MRDEVEELINQFEKETDIFTKAEILKLLLKNKQQPLKDVSAQLHFKPSHLSHILRLNNLPDSIIDGYYSGLITKTHLFLLSRIKDKKQALLIYEEVLKNNLTVGGAEELVRAHLYGIKTEGIRLSTQGKKQLIDSLIALGNNIKVKVVQTRIKGKIIFEVKGSLAKTTAIFHKLLAELQKK